MNPNYRLDLNIYYKFVRVCKSCNKKYGSDLDNENRYCPICDLKIKQRGSLLNHTRKWNILSGLRGHVKDAIRYLDL